MKRSPHIVYVILRFPYLTETFVAEEIRAVRSQGVQVSIVSLLKPHAGPVQPHSVELLSSTWYAPGLLTMALWQAQFAYFSKDAGLYWTMLTTLLRCPTRKQLLRSMAKRTVVFLKAVAVAYRFRGDQVQLLHAHFAWFSGAAAWICGPLLKIPFTVTVHANDVFASTDLLGLICGKAAHVVAISNYNRRTLARSGLRSSELTTVIHCGVNVSELQIQPSATEFGSANGSLRILSVGSLVEKKGHRILIEACNLLRERGVEFACTIIGGGPQEHQLHRQVRSLGLQDKVILLGARSHPEILAAYSNHDVFALASVVAKDGDRDGIPVVIMEAGAMGLPIVSTDVSGIPEFVRRDQTGILVPPGDARALAEAIATLAKDSNLRTELGQNARALVENEFNLATNVARLVNLWSETE
jgi:glycosyltransferase involved in cell wall biosynthesis